MRAIFTGIGLAARRLTDPDRRPDEDACRDIETPGWRPRPGVFSFPATAGPDRRSNDMNYGDYRNWRFSAGPAPRYRSHPIVSGAHRAAEP